MTVPQTTSSGVTAPARHIAHLNYRGVLRDVEVLSDADAVAAGGAAVIAAEARAAVTARGRFLLAVSGGRTPWIMLSDLAGEDVPWQALSIFQVDERV